MKPEIFKAYDIRGIYPDQISAVDFKRIAQAYAAFVKPITVAVGRDVRSSGPELQKAVIDGLLEAGVNVVDIGPGPTDALYFAVGYYGYDGGIQVSASHNPAEYNGLKMVRAGVEAISSESGLLDIKKIAESDDDLSAHTTGTLQSKDITEDYLDMLANLSEFEALTELTIVANNNFGLTGPLFEKLLVRLGMQNAIKLIKLNFEPDGTFPKGRPDPLIEENRAETIAAVKENQAALAVAWDADGDRCFFADENGDFIEGCHLTALLADYLLQSHPGEKIIYDPRNIWAVEQTVRAAGGLPILNKAGHTFIKNRMKKENALFAGEMSGHFYFRDFFGADNGIIPAVLILNILSQQPGKKISEIIAPLRGKFFVSGERNFKVADVSTVLARIKAHYLGSDVDQTDGLSVNLSDWRFNVRGSNTEPLLRLNVEGRSQAICDEKLAELTQAIKALN